jgi:membrane-associated phospholipid phosphatase
VSHDLELGAQGGETLSGNLQRLEEGALTEPYEAPAVAAFDRFVDARVDRLRGARVLDRLFYGASAVGDHGLVWLALAAWRATRPPSEDPFARKAGARVGTGIMFESLLVNGLVKAAFRRRRPRRGEHPRPLPLRQPLTSSFPSGHASAAFFAAILLGEKDRWRPLYWAVALTVATSRIYVRMHHASDVVAGALVGTGLGLLVRRAVPLRRPPTRGMGGR